MSKDQVDFGGFGSNDISVLQRTMDMLENQKSDELLGLGNRMNIAEGGFNSLAKPKQSSNQYKPSKSHRLSNSQYVPKIVREIEKQRKGVKHFETYNKNAKFWKPQPQVFNNLYQDMLLKFNGDKNKTLAHIEMLKHQGHLDQIFQNQKYDLRDMIQDKNQFV